MKTLKNTDASSAKKNVSDIQFWGNGDIFKLISKASSKKELWMKSTKAMDTGNGCVVQVTTQQGSYTGTYPFKRDENEQMLIENNMATLDYTKENIKWNIAETITFVVGVKIEETKDEDNNIVSRRLIEQ